MRKNNHGGFTLVESILVIAVMFAAAFAVYYFGWATKGKAGEQALAQDVDTVQKAIGMYLLESNGLYPTEDNRLPKAGEHKLIIWQSSFSKAGKEAFFYPDFIRRLPRHWDEAIWRIDSSGEVSANINPGDY